MHAKITFILCFFLLGNVSAQQYWQDITEEKNNTFEGVQFRQARYVTIDFKTLNQVLERPEGQSLLSIPMPNGENKIFRVQAAQLLSPEMALKYPSIKTYKGVAWNDVSSSIKLDVSSNGFNATIKSPEGLVFIESLPNSINNHVVYYTKDVQLESSFYETDLRCGNEATTFEVPQSVKQSKKDIQNLEKNNSTALDLRVYRLALACTGEYGATNGNNKESVLATFVTAVNRINTIYEAEVAVSFVLTDKVDSLIFLNAQTDPFIYGTNGGNLLGEAPSVIDRLITRNAYDVSHVFTNSCGTGGIANLFSVCNGRTASGVTCHYTNFDYVISSVMAHELGHQFGANHTMSNCGDDGSNISSGTAYEPGSGTTIMSYAGVCSAFNLAADSDPYFHISSLEDMINYSRNGRANECPTTTNVDNNEPTLSLPYKNNFFIPLSTPFELSANASDLDSNILTYCWEQYDLGPLSDLGSPTGNAPAFRSFPPSTNPTRTFPRLSTIVNNANDITEVLPTYKRDFTFRCTVRDNNPIAGASVWGEVKFKTDETAGSFLVTYPNADSIVWTTGSYQKITWDVANTNNSRVNCQKVNIKLSLNGGLSFPITLASNIPNNGETYVNIPNSISPRARIRVEAADNIFFDISNRSLKIEAPKEAGFTLALSKTYEQVCLPAVVEIDLSTTSILNYDSLIQLTLIAGLPNQAIARFSKDAIFPGENTKLSLDLSNTKIDSFITLVIQATASSLDTVYRYVLLDLVNNDFSSFALESPSNNTKGILGITTFTWTDVPNALAYDFELATSPAFGETIVSSAKNLNSNSFRPNLFLNDNTIYYWRVRPINECGANDFTVPNAFQTINVSCVDFSQTTPVRIPGNGTPTVESIITINSEGIVSDLNISKLQGSFQPVRFVEISLLSPSGTQAILFDDLCASTQIFNLGFDDEAPNAITCPPIAGVVQQPKSPLSVFDGEQLKGDWKMRFRIKQVGFGAGGSIENWTMESCGDITVNAPFLVTNDTFPLPPNTKSQIWTTTLEASDDQSRPDQIIFEVISLPKYGSLLRDEIPLTVGASFTQEDINGYLIAYQNENPDVLTDAFYFLIKDADGGWYGVEKFNIVISEDATVPTNEIDELEDTILIFPNPANELLTISFAEKPLNDFSINIFHAQGKLIKTFIPVEGSTYDLQTEQLPNGIYFLQLNNGKKIISKKFIVQH